MFMFIAAICLTSDTDTIAKATAQSTQVEVRYQERQTIALEQIAQHLGRISTKLDNCH